MDVLTNLWELGLHGETLSAVDGRVFMYQATPGASNAFKEVRECDTGELKRIRPNAATF